MVVEWEEKLPQLEGSMPRMEKMGMEFGPIRIIIGHRLGRHQDNTHSFAFIKESMSKADAFCVPRRHDTAAK